MTIQFPTYDHIDQIRQLNSKYLITHLNEVQRQNGFIRIEYDRDDLLRIIANKEIVIATNEEKVIGYYLIGRTSQSKRLNYQREKVNELFNQSESKVGYGAQTIIEREYRGQNLLSSMLPKLVELLNNKYYVLFSSVTKTNDNALKAHSKSGYKLIDEDDTKYYIALFLNEL